MKRKNWLKTESSKGYRVESILEKSVASHKNQSRLDVFKMVVNQTCSEILKMFILNKKISL